MQRDDITIEVRDRGLVRRGYIRPEDTNLTASPAFNNVGDWQLTLPVEHPMTSTLRTPGAGIIVVGPQDVLFSGPMVTASFVANQGDPMGSITFTGVTDEIALADAVAFPQPSNIDPTTQTVGHDTRTGSVESVMHAFVNANIGPSAPAARRKANLIMGTNSNRGPTITKSARFPVLGSLLSEIAALGDMGFRIVQLDDQLVFQTYAVTDRTKFIRLDLWNNTLAEESVAISAPGATQVIIAGQGEDTERTFYAATSADALQAQTDWGRRIESFVDQRQTDDMTEYEQKADEILTEQGHTVISVQAKPMDDTTMRYGIDWNLGDKIAAVTDDGEYAGVVSGVAIKVDKDGFQLGVTLGNQDALDDQQATLTKIKDIAQRVSNLERSGQPRSTV